MSRSQNNSIQKFYFNGNPFRAVTNIDIPGFIAKDTCDILGIGNSRQALSYLDDDEKGVIINDTLGGPQKMAYVTEAGLYTLILRSRKPEAHEFRRWVTHTVLPSIRKHGAYATPVTIDRIINNPDFGIKLLTDLKEERNKRQAAERQVEAQKPKVLFADAVTTSKSSILIGELAKIIKQNGIPMGQNRLFKWMRANGYLESCHGQRWNLPTQRSMEMGLFEIKKSTHVNSDGSVIVVRTPKVTGKGQQYFVNKFFGKAA